MVTMLTQPSVTSMFTVKVDAWLKKAYVQMVWCLTNTVIHLVFDVNWDLTLIVVSVLRYVSQHFLCFFSFFHALLTILLEITKMCFFISTFKALFNLIF